MNLALFDLESLVSATLRLMQWWAEALQKTLVSLGVPDEYARPDVLIKMPTSAGLFAVVMLLAAMAPRKTRSPIILLGSLLFALAAFGHLYVLALLSAVVFTFAYHHIALTIIHFRTPHHLLDTIQHKLPDKMAHQVLHGVQELERRLPPWGPRLFLANFWIISTAALVYSFRRSSDWFVAMPPPVHFLHVSGLAFLYIKLLAYSRDCLYGHLPRVSLFDMVNWVFFHPTIRLGPILRYGEFQSLMASMPQRVTRRDLAWGVFRILTGNLRILAMVGILKVSEPPPTGWNWLPSGSPNHLWEAFFHPQNFSTPMLLLGVYLQLLRFYLLFSASADISVGLCHLVGVKLPENFDCPLIARNIADFWRRWHITLGAFCRTDIYIPLGGNRRHTTLNYYVIFLFIGLWHELGWTFALWGLLQATGMAVHRWFKLWCEKRSAASANTLEVEEQVSWGSRLKRMGSVIVTQAFVALSFTSLYDSYAGGLLLFETLLRRMVGCAAAPAWMLPMVEWLNAVGHRFTMWSGAVL